MDIGKVKKVHTNVPRPERAIPVENWPTKKEEERGIPVEIPKREKVEAVR